MRKDTKMRAGMRGAVPAAVLATVAALPASGMAAPKPPSPGHSGESGPSPRPAAGPKQAEPQASGQEEAAKVPCTRGAGDEALVRALRAGGRIALAPNCTYTVTKRHGPNSALPPITRDTTLEGSDSTIAWGGRGSVPSMIEIGGENVRLVLRGVTLRGSQGMATVRNRPGASGSVESYGSNKTVPGEKQKSLRGDETATQLAQWLAPAITGEN